MHKNRVNHYFYGNRPSRLLANKLKTNDQFTNIGFITSESGTTISDPKLINQRFSNFYRQLYTSDNLSSKSEKKSYLEKLNLTTLSTDEASILGSPLSLDELKQSLAKMNKGRSPGSDGINPEVYLKFWTLLGPPLLDMFNTAVQKGSFGREVNTALITLLLKKDKDPTNCANYRPLSLLNADVKLFSKTLASRLEVYLSKLIHPDQSGFVKKCLSADNMRRLLHLLDTSDNRSSNAILSVDAEKAFDRLEWSFLWSVLN